MKPQSLLEADLVSSTPLQAETGTPFLNKGQITHCDSIIESFNNNNMSSSAAAAGASASSSDKAAAPAKAHYSGL